MQRGQGDAKMLRGCCEIVEEWGQYLVQRCDCYSGFIKTTSSHCVVRPSPQPIPGITLSLQSPDIRQDVCQCSGHISKLLNSLLIQAWCKMATLIKSHSCLNCSSLLIYGHSVLWHSKPGGFLQLCEVLFSKHFGCSIWNYFLFPCPYFSP